MWCRRVAHTRQGWFVPCPPAGRVVAEVPEPFVRSLGCDPERGGDLSPCGPPVSGPPNSCFNIGLRAAQQPGRLGSLGEGCVSELLCPVHDQPSLTADATSTAVDVAGSIAATVDATPTGVDEASSVIDVSDR